MPDRLSAGRHDRVQDPRQDLIIPGRENISSVEVEIALYRHPETQLAAVVGELPTAATGKIQKYVLRERARALS